MRAGTNRQTDTLIAILRMHRPGTRYQSTVKTINYRTAESIATNNIIEKKV